MKHYDNVDKWIKKHKSTSSDEEKELMHQRFGELLEKYEGKFYYRYAHTFHPEKYPPNELTVDVGYDTILVTALICSCPCEICGHTIQKECYYNNCDCCSETCT